MSAAHRFKLVDGEASKPSLALAPPPAFATFDGDRAAELMVAAKSAVSTTEILLAFIHNHRAIARDAGIETITIELFAITQGQSFIGVIDAIEEARQGEGPLVLSHGGLSTLRRLEALLAEASMNIRKFTEEDFSSMELAVNEEKSKTPSSMGSSVHIAQASQSKSADLSALVPFAIFSAILATVAVVVMVTKEK